MIFATGTTGTIGKHLSNSVESLSVDLSENFYIETSRSMNDGILIHLAGIVGETQVTNDVNYARKVNVSGTARLGTLALEAGIRKFVFLSSSHIYKKKSSKIFETDPIETVSHYAEQKIAAEEKLRQIFQADPDRLLILRVFSILDWLGKDFTLSGAIRNLIDSKVDRIANGSDVRDFMQPFQVAKLVEELSNLQDACGVFNLCSGMGLTIKTATLEMLKKAGHPELIKKVEMGNSINPYIVGDTSRIEKLVNLNKLAWMAPPYVK
jgi:nucleoside-diphosphate-sugar epimerase